MPDSEQPRYNPKAVLRETGLRPDTLRAWERRYGIPQPERTPSGHRLYSRRDIETLKWLSARLGEGLRISTAVAMWQNFIDQGQDPLGSSPASLKPQAAQGSDVLMSLRQTWLNFCANFDERGSDELLNEAFGQFPPEVVATSVLQQGLAEIGEAWERGDFSVHQEHFAASVAMRRLNALLSTTPAPWRIKRLVLAGPAGEEHAFPLLLLTYLLRREGWNATFLGINVPLEMQAAALKRMNPELMIYAAQRIQPAAELRAAAECAARLGIPVGYGGRFFNLFPAACKVIDGFYLGPSLVDAPGEIAQLLNGGKPGLRPSSAPPAAEQDGEAFTARRGSIERLLSSRGSIAMIEFNLAVTGDIQAALALGRIDLLGTPDRWLQGLAVQFGVGAETLEGYPGRLLQAIKQELGSSPAGFEGWLAPDRLTG